MTTQQNSSVGNKERVSCPRCDFMGTLEEVRAHYSVHSADIKEESAREQQNTWAEMDARGIE